MSHMPARLAGLAAMVAALMLAPPAVAGGVPTHALKARTKQHAKHCASKTKRGRAACAKAAKKVATVKSSPCTGLSRKRAAGKPTSAFARCMIRERKKAGQDPAADNQASDGGSADSSDPADEIDDPLADDSLADNPFDVAADDPIDAIDLGLDAPDLP